jgi:hypothetical protein
MVLEKKLQQKGVKYTENNDIEDMIYRNIKEVPVLQVDGRFYGFTEAIRWINEQEEIS